ncbi:MAG: DEAD/DEAH box helicase [Siphonobacter sp.]
MPEPNSRFSTAFILAHLNITTLQEAQFSSYQMLFPEVRPESITLNEGIFVGASRLSYFPAVLVKQEPLQVACECGAGGVCEHAAHVLVSILERNEFRVFFDEKLRQAEIRKVARNYGLEEEQRLDDYFQIEYEDKTFRIIPKQPELLAINDEHAALLKQQLFPAIKPLGRVMPAVKRILVFTKQRYYENFCIELFEASFTKKGKIKHPLTAINPLDLLHEVETLEVLKFYTAVSRFQQHFRAKNEQADIDNLRLVIKNPLQLDVFYHDAKKSEQVSVKSLVPIGVQHKRLSLTLSIHKEEKLYEITGEMLVNDKAYGLELFTIRYDYFMLLHGELILIDNVNDLRVVLFLKQRNNKAVVHTSKYRQFSETILQNLENRVRIHYSYVKPATFSQKEAYGFNDKAERILYLEDSGDYVIMTPVLRYGTVEIPILSRKEIYSVDHAGNPFYIERDDEAEIQYTTILLNHHPDFQEQNKSGYFYFPKRKFLDENWVLDTFERWKNDGITILGFNKLQGNRLNPNKAKVSVTVRSGISWFETSLGVSFGKQKATLKHLHKAVKNQQRYILLDDGTKGILPEEWLRKFTQYFASSEMLGECLRTPKVNFASIRDWYAEEMLTPETRLELNAYAEKFANFYAIQRVEIPEDLQTTLRDYQKEGLNWLNFLDDFEFGGCLADDMGLGKTVQIIAFILSQRAKHSSNINLVVVPTSLIYNWQTELAKFAPSVRVLTLYGASRVQHTETFDQYEVILTSYGTLLTDIRFLKKYEFNYIFLDESQAIKNPDSQRYKAVWLLQARNRIVLTGTPIENHTFDLYGQLSFACPGLLGSYQYFKEYYSTPIDRFGDRERALELQQKISPFLLRRTKQQVAPELPDKTEMVIYCEMGADQRRVYDAYEREFRNYLLTKKEIDIAREKLHILASLTKLRQICNSPVLINDEAYYGDQSAKIDALLEQIESKSPEHKILIFSQFVSMLDLIRKELTTRNIGFEYLTGKTRDRARRVEHFQNNPEIRIFLISLKAGGIGLNLTQADYVYLVDPWWNPAVENQAIDRTHRIGQKQNVVAVRLICPDTIEEKMLKLQESKRSLASELIRTDEEVLKSLTREELLRLVE